MSETQTDYATRGKTIFRVEKNKDNPFVMIDRRVIENPKLSWKAKGLLAYLLSRPDNWVVHFRDLVNRAPDKAHTVRAAMKELRAAGHVKVEAQREKGRVKQWVYTIHESPDVEFQQVEIQQVENHTLNDTDLSNDTESTNTGVPPLPLDWQIAMGAKVSLSEEEIFKAKVRDSASLIDFQCPGAGQLAEAFMLARHIVIPQSKAKGNRKAAREMMDLGVRAAHITQATQALMDKNLTVVDLFSVSKTAIDLANRKDTSTPQPKQTSPEELARLRAQADAMFARGEL